MVDPAVPIQLLYVDQFREGSSPVPGLERAGRIDVTVAGTGAEAADLLGNDDFDCIVCGAELSDESGFEFCRRMREGTSVPTVMVGSEQTESLIERALDAGAVDYMSRTLLTASPALFGARLRRIVDEAVDPVGPSPLDVLPLPALLADDRVHYANDAARTTFADETLVGRPIDALFEVDEPLTDHDEVRGHIEATGEAVTIRTMSLPDSALALTVVFVDGVTGEVDEDLVERANMLDSILTQIPLAVYFKDRDSRHVAVSDYLSRMNPDGRVINPEGKVHHTIEDILGKTDFDLYPSEHAEQTVADEQEIIETEEPVINKTEYTYTPDHELMRLSTSKAPWYGPEGEVRGIVGITANVTDEKRYEDTVDYQRDVLGLIQSVLEEPVTDSIAEITDIVDELPADDTAVDELATTVADVEEHVAVVGTLLQDGKQQLGTELVDIEQLARRSWEHVDTADATMAVTYNGIIRADPAKVGQLFDELFENAVVHGGPEVHVTVEQFEDGFFVADDGAGIPPGERRHVFEYGYSTDEDAIGSGLTIAETVASSLGWQLTTVESADGGCRFEVTGVTFE